MDNEPYLVIEYFFVNGNQLRVNQKRFGIPFTNDFEKIIKKKIKQNN